MPSNADIDHYDDPILKEIFHPPTASPVDAAAPPSVARASLALAQPQLPQPDFTRSADNSPQSYSRNQRRWPVYIVAVSEYFLIHFENLHSVFAENYYGSQTPSIPSAHGNQQQPFPGIFQPGSQLGFQQPTYGGAGADQLGSLAIQGAQAFYNSLQQAGRAFGIQPA